jgi:protein-tyrosine phosphatase
MKELNRPLTESYWVKPGRFLAGEHPAVSDKKRTRKRLIKLLEAGIDTFYDLTVLDESPAYLPILREEARKREIKIQHIRFPILFHNVPPRGMMIAILDAIDSALDKERNVYLYCWDGISGTGTTVGCYLVRHSLTGEQALKQLTELWEDVPKSDYFPQSTESNQQRAYVLNWWENLPSTPPSPEPPTRPAPKGIRKFVSQRVPSFDQPVSWPRKLLTKLFQRKNPIQSQDSAKKDVPTRPMTELTYPIRESYWVESGRFLAGEYPAAPFIGRARARIGGLLDLGIDTFIDLTIPKELPPYLLVLEEQAKQRNIEVQYKRFSILDRSIPTHAEMIELLDYIDTALANGHNVYLHCWGGIGRTGTTVGCYLVRHGLTGEQALAQLAEWWKDVPKSAYTPRSPETDRQVEFILKWDENSPSP